MNSLQNCLTVSNIPLENVVADTFSKSAQAILDKIMEPKLQIAFVEIFFKAHEEGAVH